MNFEQAATAMGTQPEIVAELVRQKLLPADATGQISASEAHSFLRGTRMASLPRIRREVAAQRAAVEAEEQRLLDKRAKLVERLEIATADGDLAMAQLAMDALTLLDGDK